MPRAVTSGPPLETGRSAASAAMRPAAPRLNATCSTTMSPHVRLGCDANNALLLAHALVRNERRMKTNCSAARNATTTYAAASHTRLHRRARVYSPFPAHAREGDGAYAGRNRRHSPGCDLSPRPLPRPGRGDVVSDFPISSSAVAASADTAVGTTQIIASKTTGPGTKLTRGAFRRQVKSGGHSVSAAGTESGPHTTTLRSNRRRTKAAPRRRRLPPPLPVCPSCTPACTPPSPSPMPTSRSIACPITSWAWGFGFRI
mmetsp:Transcript_23421/g.58051  ORF Transcript_23421/g.58051 Transcript_23421/m.58051 type:complete len:259 (+) Transcript_23421:2759-3535(+)